MLSALDSTDPNTVVAGASKKLEDKEGEEKSDAGEDGKEEKAEEEQSPEDKIAAMKEAAKLAATADESSQNDESVGVIDNDFEETDDINEIPDSRTFLVRVSSRGMAIHWLDLGEYDPSDAVTAMGFLAPEVVARQNAVVMEPPAPQYYTQGMSFAGPPMQPMVPPQAQQYYYQMPGGQPQQQQYSAPQQQWPVQYAQQPIAAPGTVPVTAGEAAAQQQKQNQGLVDGGDANVQSQWQVVYPGQVFPYGGQSQGEQQDQLQDEVNGVSGLGAMGEEPDAKRLRSV